MATDGYKMTLPEAAEILASEAMVAMVNAGHAEIKVTITLTLARNTADTDKAEPKANPSR